MSVKGEQQKRMEAHVTALFRHYGPQHWWPGRDRFEVIAGAILTQQTTWNQAEAAIRNLRGAGVMSVRGLRGTPLRRLEALLRPSGYYRQKARTLRRFVKRLDRKHGGSLSRLFRLPTEKLREELLSVKGIGEETADAILAYAGGRPVFVVDAYARRILTRHGLVRARSRAQGDAQIRTLVDAARRAMRTPPEGRGGGGPRHPASRMSRKQVSAEARAYQELHAMVVRVGVEHCRRRPQCGGCPLARWRPRRNAKPKGHV
jgi:endonuclease-3 related protein